MAKLDIGDTAPTFSLPNQDRETVNLSNFKGKFVVVYFYPKDNTPGCTTQGCNFRDFNQEIKDAGGVVLGISKDSVESHKKFSTAKEFNFDILSDEEHKVAESFGAWGEKKMFGKSYMGMHRMTFLINPESKIVKIWKKANPKTNAAEALEAIQRIANSE